MFCMFLMVHFCWSASSPTRVFSARQEASYEDGIFTTKGLGYLQDKGQGKCSEGCIHILLLHKVDRPLYSKYPKGEFVHKCRYKRPTSAMRHASMTGTNTNTTAGQCATLQWMLHVRRAGCKVRRPLHFWSYSRWKILLMEYASSCWKIYFDLQIMSISALLSKNWFTLHTVPWLNSSVTLLVSKAPLNFCVFLSGLDIPF